MQSLFRKIFFLLLQRYLKSFDFIKTEFSILEGTIVLQNVHIKENLFVDWPIPFTVRQGCPITFILKFFPIEITFRFFDKGFVERVQICIPWQNILWSTNKSSVLRIDNAFVIITPCDFNEVCHIPHFFLDQVSSHQKYLYLQNLSTISEWFLREKLLKLQAHLNSKLSQLSSSNTLSF
jgi:hypothetical protein